MPNGASLNCLAFDQGNCIACHQIVAGLLVLKWQAWVLIQLDLVGPFYEMIRPGLFSTALFAVTGSTNFFCNMASIMCEISSALG